jgi:choline kinase
MEQKPMSTKHLPVHDGPADSPCTVIRKAIILAAGVGDRLQPFTQLFPKCLAPVNGVPILVNALTHLSDAGVNEVVIVVGHHKEKIYERIGETFNALKVTYIESESYATTNNIYSLWLARKHLVEDVLLLEADVFFERRLLDRMLSYESGSLAAVSRHQSWMSGTVVSVNKAGNIQALMDARDQGPDFDYSKVFKTANIYLFRGEFLRRYFVDIEREWLMRYLLDGIHKEVAVIYFTGTMDQGVAGQNLFHQTGARPGHAQNKNGSFITDQMIPAMLDQLPVEPGLVPLKKSLLIFDRVLKGLALLLIG